MNLQNLTIAVIGLGYVGLPLAVEFGKKRKVIGFDTNLDRVIELQGGSDHTLEVSCEELVSASNLSFTSNKEDLSNARIYIVTVPTPVDGANRPDLGPLKKASSIVGGILKPGDVVIFESTVYPGVTEEVCVPILKESSGLKFLTTDNISDDVKANGFYCGYSPERINPGDKSHRLPSIKKVTSGSTPRVAEAIDSLYKEIVDVGTFKASSIKVAEAAKVIENAQRDLNIAFVNELSLIFNLIGIDTAEVLEAASSKWNFMPFKPGLVGGHCIGVDPYYLTYKAQELGYHPEVILSGRRINDGMGRYAAQSTIRLMLKNGINVAGATVGILGVTFKENCPDVRNSKVFDIASELLEWGIKVRAMDPWANPDEVKREYGIELSQITKDNPVEALIIAVAHKEFVQMTPAQLRSLCTKNSHIVIADLKSLYSKSELKEQGFEVFRF